MEYCIQCEKKAVANGKTKIKVGEKELTLSAEHCKECDAVYLSAENQEQIDKWGNELSTTVAELQPYFSRDLIEVAQKYAAHFGLKPVELIKACTTFYLSDMTTEKTFKKLRGQVLMESEKLFSGAKKKVHVPVRYRLFKQLELFSDAWNVHQTNVLEEAMLFCMTLLVSHKKHLSEKSELEEFVEKYAMAS